MIPLLLRNKCQDCFNSRGKCTGNMSMTERHSKSSRQNSISFKRHSPSMLCLTSRIRSRLTALVDRNILRRVLVDSEKPLGMKNSRSFTADKERTKEYEGRKLVGFSVEQMYSVVSDVENYRKFVPFCKKSEILSRNEKSLKASLVIGFPPLNESYTSRVTMNRPHYVKAECTDGKLFNHLNTLWIFSPGLKNNPDTSVIDFSLSFEFKSILHSHLSNLFFNEIVRQMENAFIQEARKRYGRPCIKTVRLER